MNPVVMIKVKVHQRSKTLEGSMNEKADLAAKKEARMGCRWVMP